MNDFEFDKIVLAIAFALLILIFCINLGNFIYYPEIKLTKEGYKIEIKTEISLPEKADEINEQNLDLTQILQKSNSANGALIFKKCSVCHSIDKGGSIRIGPNLWQIVDKKVAANKTYVYSTAMSEKGNKGDKWDITELFAYLKSPKKHVPGTKMAFAGIKKLEDRADLIAYLQTAK